MNVSYHFILCFKVMDSSEPCSLPGGLASIKKQFESQEFSSSSASQSTVTQYHYQQRQVMQINTQGIHSTNSIEPIKTKTRLDEKVQFAMLLNLLSGN